MTANQPNDIPGSQVAPNPLTVALAAYSHKNRRHGSFFLFGWGFTVTDIVDQLLTLYRTSARIGGWGTQNH